MKQVIELHRRLVEYRDDTFNSYRAEEDAHTSFLNWWFMQKKEVSPEEFELGREMIQDYHQARLDKQNIVRRQRSDDAKRRFEQEIVDRRKALRMAREG